MAKKQKQEKKSWVAIIKCSVRKHVVCEDCTEEEARNNPWNFAVDETEIDQEDWDVVSVEENR